MPVYVGSSPLIKAYLGAVEITDAILGIVPITPPPDIETAKVAFITDGNQTGFNTNGTGNVDWGDGNLIPYASGDVFGTAAEDAVCRVYPDTGTSFKFIPDNKVIKSASIDAINMTSMSGMFTGQSILTIVNIINTQSVTNMGSMFRTCNNFNSPLNFDTQSVTTMSNMFNGCNNFNSPLNFNTQNVTAMDRMFQNCSNFNQPLSFNTQSVTNMATMFINTTAFNQDLTAWNVDGVTNCGSFANGSGLTVENYPPFTSCDVFAVDEVLPA